MVRNIKVSSVRGVDCFPLSPMQQGMLFHSFERGVGVDIEQVICELHEEINAAQFEKAWREVVARHASLRTSFHWAEDEGEAPQQVVHAAADVRMAFRCEEFGSEREAERGLEEYLELDRREGFQLDAAPLVRVALLRGGPAHYWWVFTYHHLVMDARSMFLVFREAMDFHDALASGRKAEAPPARSYRHYVDWLQTLDWTRAERFWRETLRGFSAPTALPIAHPAEATTRDNDLPGELMLRLPEAVTKRMRATARRHDATINTLLQAGWATVLSRYAGEEDVVFGAVRACRHIPIEGAGAIVGLFINTVPLRVRVSADAPVATWLQELREQWLAMREHEHTPLRQIQPWSDVAPGRPLFETLLNYQEPSWDAALNALGGPWSGRHFDIRAQPNYPLAVDAWGDTTITIKLCYDRRRFADAAVARMLGHFATVLEALGEESCATVGELPLLTPFERDQLFVGWNDTAADYPRGVSVHAFVEANAEEAPTRLAVADPRCALSFGELNHRANRLAHRLRALGVGPDVLVAVAMERSVEMIVAWLAVLKAGGAFVPLDPGYPKDRLAFQLGDCGANVILTQAHVRAALPEIPAAIAVLEVKAEGRGFESESDRNLAPAATADHLAYVIYTSGSTGQPKGVQIEHGALMNLVSWHQNTYELTSRDRATHLASPAFDASIWEIWPYLAAGASVHIPDEDTRIAPAALVQWLAAHSITIAFIPTPLAEAALTERWPGGMGLRALLTGGDKLKRQPPADFPCALINHYGPTENTVVATCSTVRPGADGAAPAIGRPIDNTRVYVLDAAMRPVPVGVPGELYIGGDSLARGYLNRPELTAERFVSDPFWSAATCRRFQTEDAGQSGGEPPHSKEEPRSKEARLYRTGDLVRWCDDGELEFLGRLDGQVKIRGCRIELGEVEATLQRHPLVRDALVLARDDHSGQSQLIAYVRPAETGAPTGEQLAEFLHGALPAHMVPAAFGIVDAWPLTSNGKIDRKALPVPDTASTSATDFVAPASRMEETVAGTWAEILGRARVGTNDNFFELGGHSLLAAQVISRLNRTLSSAISVRSLFDHPTVAELAREIGRQCDANAAPRLPLARTRRRSPSPEMELVQPS